MWNCHCLSSSLSSSLVLSFIFSPLPSCLLFSSLSSSLFYDFYDFYDLTRDSPNVKRNSRAAPTKAHLPLDRRGGSGAWSRWTPEGPPSHLSRLVFSLSFSVSLSVSVCCCGGGCCCGALLCVSGVVVCAVWCVVCDTLKKNRCTQHVPVCTCKTSPCVPAPRAHTRGTC